MRLFVSGATTTLRRHLDRDRLGLLLVPGAGNSPQTAHELGLPWAADNAAFSGFRPNAFCSLLARIGGHSGCRFVACPDVVGNATETLRLFSLWAPVIRSLGLPVALVAQDGLERLTIPWELIDALFLGGSTDWKLGREAAGIAREAKSRSLWLHMGRVNTRARVRYAFHLGCDSIDGSGFSRWPEQRVPRGLRWLAEVDGRPEVIRASSAGGLFRGGDRFSARGWPVECVERTPTGYVVTVRSSRAAVPCPTCGDRAAGPPYCHGSRSRRVWDIPRDGMPVKLILRRSRYRCRKCNTVFSSHAEGLSKVCPVTLDLAAWLIRREEQLTRKEMSKQIGISTRTIRKWLRLLLATREEHRRGLPARDRE